MEAASPSTTSPDNATRPPHRWRRLSVIWHTTFFLLFVLPVAISAGLYAASDHPRSFRDANWSSTGLLPPAASDPEARVVVFAARNGNLARHFRDPHLGGGEAAGRRLHTL